MINQNLFASNKELNAIKKIKEKGKKIILCHGTFDLIHPGHLNHFEEAKSLGDVLIVTLTADKFITKNIHSPFNNQETRKNFLKNLKIVDYVFIVNGKDALPAIKVIKPNIYCKGLEYKKDDRIGNLQIEKKILKKNGGKIIFLGKNPNSSSKLISSNIFNIKDQTLNNFLKKTDFSKIDEIQKKLSKLKILVIGETIIDKYTYVKTVGVSPKSNTLSCIEVKKENMPGGTLATYKFLSSFIKNVKHISIINKKLLINKNLLNLRKLSPEIIKSENYSRLVKKRIVEEGIDTSVKKILTLNEFETKILEKKDENKVLNLIKKYIRKTDLIILQDFGHGFFTKKIINLLNKNSKKLSINVQTNSLNYGYNIISKKYKKCYLFSLDERELQLSEGRQNINHQKSLKNLLKLLSAKRGFLTCGGEFSMLSSGNKIYKVPILNNKAVDTMGAGDIFHAAASIMSYVSKNDKLNLLFAQIAGAHAVEIVGNSDIPKINELFNTLNFYKFFNNKKFQ